MVVSTRALKKLIKIEKQFCVWALNFEVHRIDRNILSSVTTTNSKSLNVTRTQNGSCESIFRRAPLQTTRIVFLCSRSPFPYSRSTSQRTEYPIQFALSIIHWAKMWLRRVKGFQWKISFSSEITARDGHLFEGNHLSVYLHKTTSSIEVTVIINGLFFTQHKRHAGEFNKCSSVRK